jgi:hypothetical protein
VQCWSSASCSQVRHAEVCHDAVGCNDAWVYLAAAPPSPSLCLFLTFHCLSLTLPLFLLTSLTAFTFISQCAEVCNATEVCHASKGSHGAEVGRAEGELKKTCGAETDVGQDYSRSSGLYEDRQAK